MDVLVEEGDEERVQRAQAEDEEQMAEASTDVFGDDVASGGRVSSGLQRLQRGLQRASGSRHGSQKSLKHYLTNEVVPHIDHYRNRLSFAAEPSSSRPTLEELLDRGDCVRHSWRSTCSWSRRLERGRTSKLPPLEFEVDQSSKEIAPLKFGWIVGVYLPCLLNIWGVMLFLRLPWVVGQAGLLEALAIITVANVVTTLTTISMSAVCTNGQMRGGGIYFMISRSLGPEFGGAVGIMFTLANAVAVAVYVIGFCESVLDLVKQYYPHFDSLLNLGRLNDVRLLGSLTMLVILAIVLVGMDWVNRVQLLLLILLLVAQLDFVVGVVLPHRDETQRAKGMRGLSLEVLKANLWSKYSRTESSEEQYDAIKVFAIFFPAATGICAGASMSGDLKDPAMAIPKGTLFAILTSYISYVLYALLTASSALRLATGHLEDAHLEAQIMLAKCEETKSCQFGTASHQQMMQLMSVWGPLIYAGCFAATLSSAMGALVGGPRVFQAVALDKLFPFVSVFGQGYGPNKEPLKGYLLTFVLSMMCVLMGDLNTVSSLLSNFFVATYALINYAVFHASFHASPGWRPSFSYFNKWLSLLATLLCMLCMLLMDVLTALITLMVAILLYVFVRTRHPTVNWGSSMQSESFLTALKAVHALAKVEDHIKNYRPKLLVLSGMPSDRPTLIDFAHLVTRRDSYLHLVHVVRVDTDTKTLGKMREAAETWVRGNRIKAFVSMHRSHDLINALRNCMELSGLGKLSANTLLMGFMETWWSDETRANQYMGCLRVALDFRMAIAILRVSGGLDVAEVDGVRERLQVEAAKLTRTSSNLSIDEQDGRHNEAVQEDEEEDRRSTTPSTRQCELSAPRSESESEQFRRCDVLRQTPSTASTLSSTQRRLISGNPIDDALLRRLLQFRSKSSTVSTTLDIYWLYDDGGLTLLVPHILASRSIFSKCRLRVFFLSKKSKAAVARANMAALLTRFRIPVDELVALEGATRPPAKETLDHFEAMLNDQRQHEVNSQLPKWHTWTLFQLRIAELIRSRSRTSNLVVSTLPLPPKDERDEPLYLAALDFTSRNMPPFLFIRGNQQSVLTFYS